MGLSPLDIHHKEFRTARFGGYNEEEVDSFLDLVADDFERMIQEDTELKQQIEQMNKRLSEFEEMQATLQNALLAATKSAELMRQQAMEESEAIVTKAREEADALTSGAKEQAREMIQSADNEKQKLEQNLADLKEIKKRYVRGLKEVAELHLLQVEELDSMYESETPHDVLQTVAGTTKVEVETAPVLIAEPPIQAPRVEEQEVSALPDCAEQQVAEPEVQPIEEIFTPPTLENSAAPLLEKVIIEPVIEAPGEISVTIGEKAGVVNRTALKSKLVEPKAQVVQDSEWVDVAEKEIPSSSDLIDEVLPVDERNRLYAEFGDVEGGTARGQKGRKGRKDKREKHFFWE